MRFGLFGSAQANGSDLGAGTGQGFHDYIDFNVDSSTPISIARHRCILRGSDRTLPLAISRWTAGGEA